MDDENKKVVVFINFIRLSQSLSEITDPYSTVQRGATLLQRTAQHQPSQQSPIRLSPTAPQSTHTSPPASERSEPAS